MDAAPIIGFDPGARSEVHQEAQQMLNDINLFTDKSFPHLKDADYLYRGFSTRLEYDHLVDRQLAWELSTRDRTGWISEAVHLYDMLLPQIRKPTQQMLVKRETGTGSLMQHMTKNAQILRDATQMWLWYGSGTAFDMHFGTRDEQARMFYGGPLHRIFNISLFLATEAKELHMHEFLTDPVLVECAMARDVLGRPFAGTSMFYGALNRTISRIQEITATQPDVPSKIKYFTDIARKYAGKQPDVMWMMHMNAMRDEAIRERLLAAASLWREEIEAPEPEEEAKAEIEEETQEERGTKRRETPEETEERAERQRRQAREEHMEKISEGMYTHFTQPLLPSAPPYHPHVLP